MADGRARVERVDLVGLREASPEARRGVAERIFQCWQPLFPHLADEDAGFHLRKHVEDPRPVLMRAYFVVDDSGRDRSLAITRFCVTPVDGGAVGTFTVHAGMRKPDRTRDLGPRFLRDILEFRLRFRGVPLYFAELLTHPAVYVTVRHGFPGLRPGHDGGLDPALAPIVAIVASLHDAKPLDGGLSGLCETPMVPEYSPVRAAAWAAVATRNRDLAWFLEQISPGVGQVVVAPLAWRNLPEVGRRVLSHTMRPVTGRKRWRAAPALSQRAR